MANSNTYTHQRVITHELRASPTARVPATRAADLALLRVVLGLPAAAEVRWSACR